VGHRVVHGGVTYSKPVLIDSKVMAELETLIPLAPLHEPHHIAAIRAISAIAPKVPQIACFDTAFHRSQPAVAQEFALPRELTAKGVRRYGFHGLSYEYIVSVLPELMPDCAKGKVVVAHLGNGASMCAIDRGQSVASTMGFTAVDGLPMGTRTGALDPGVILYLLQHERMDAQAIEQLIYQRSGLLGVSGISSDMRTLLAPQEKPSTSSSTGLDASSDLLPRRWAGSTRSFSPQALVSTRPRFGLESAGMHVGSASHWTRRPMPKAAHAFRVPAPPCRLG
jgi:acetate kinase